MEVIDSKGKSYIVDKEISNSAHEATCLLKGGGFIVKLFHETKYEDKVGKLINFLRRLELDKCRFAVPMIEIKQPSRGYICEIPKGMMSLSDLIWTGQSKDANQWFKETGGALRRYRVLRRLAEALQSIHAKGLIFCGFSPEKLFISEDKTSDEVFFADLDNLRFKTNIVKNTSNPIYDAPEILRNVRSNSFESDCYSFAVLTCQLLNLNHTFDGAPSNLFVTQNVDELFKRNFDNGINDPLSRPTMGEWVEALSSAYNELIKCPNCGAYYPSLSQGNCPVCKKSSSSIVTLQVRRWEEVEIYDKSTNEINKQFKLSPNIYEEIYLDSFTPKYIMSSHFLCEGREEDPLLQIKVIETKDSESLIEIVPCKNRNYYVALNPKEIFYSETPKKIRLTDSKYRQLIIGIDNLSQHQRVITIK